MAKILSIQNGQPLVRENIVKAFWQSFLSLSHFDRLMLIIFFLLIAVTPYVIASNQVFFSRGQVAKNTFVEPFTWQGDHGATIQGGASNSVWWNAHNWDTRGDTANNPVECPGADIPCGGNHIDVHVSTADLLDGTRPNNKYVIGGDGSPGVATMHLDFEAIQSGRLRNPMLISSTNPGIVEFRTTNFVTTAHWWEIAIAPTNIVTGGEFTAVPNPGSGSGGFLGNPGPGHAPAEDSINFITIGQSDVSCNSMQTGVTKAIGGVKTDFLGPTVPTDPTEKDKLFKWRLEYYPDKIVVLRDSNGDGIMEPFHIFNVTIAWSEVYVYFLGIAYQADHHPQGACFQGQIREIPWKEVKVSPVKYTKTRAYPKEMGTLRIPKDTGWLGYDMRDNQRFGIVNGISQPNAGHYSKHGSMAFCHEVGSGWFDCKGGPTVKTLTFDLPAEDSVGISQAKFIYDIKKEGSATLAVNGNMVGELPKWTTVVHPQTEDPTMWVERSIDVDPSFFKAGTNTITITMTDNVGFDRLQFEFGYAGINLPTPTAIPTPTPTPVPQGVLWLSTVGNKIVDELGRTVVLRGVNLENREWIWASSQSIDFEKRAIPVIAGKPLLGWGANVILIAVASGPINRNESVYLSALDEIVSLAKANNAYTLIVYRYGEPNTDQVTMPDQAAQDALAALALRYQNEPAVLYGLQVEPHDVSWSTLKPRFISMIDAIRANNPKALIAVPGTHYSRYIYHAIDDPILRSNIIFKTHPYDTWPTIQSTYRLGEVSA